MRDWEQFVQHTPWFAEPGDVTVTEDEGPWSRDPLDALPNLTTLLVSATVTGLSVAGKPYELFVWGPVDRRRGWLCELPPGPVPEHVHETHHAFWSVCGGIVERFGEPEGWWRNQDEVLTASAAATDVSEVLDDYRWLWDDEGLEVPIEPGDHYPVAVEANGNLTLVHRDSGQLVLFAPDHAFAGVTPLLGCPPYSLLTIDGVPDLGSWIEECAAAWLKD
jgi:hypothetical protein